MTLNEFNAWLEGYSASFKDGAPNAEQWTQIVNKLANVEYTPVIISNPDPIRQVSPFQPYQPYSPYRTEDPIPYWLQPVICSSARLPHEQDGRDVN